MPELPEVETVRRGLERLIVGRRIANLTVLCDKSFRIAEESTLDRDLLDTTIDAVRRRGKVLIMELGSGQVLVAHLKMTGQLVVRAPGEHWGAGHPTESLIGELPDRSTRVVIGLDGGTTLYFNDQRKFGWLALMPSAAVGALPLVAAMGPEPLTGDPWPQFHARVRRHQATSIKAAILNQAVIAGVGNIYADESLWAARVHPTTPVRALDDATLRQLLAEVRAVMEVSLAAGGSTDRTYVDAEGRRGSYLTFAHVFRREGDACDRCGTTLVKTRVAGRGTHWCPTCQPVPG